MKKGNLNEKNGGKFQNLLETDYIPWFEGRPDRETAISQDDITNLNIALNTTSNLGDFLALT